MFGYVTVNQPEMKFKDFDAYKSFYCGLCNSLKRGYGIRGQMILTYDLTFLAILLTALYEPETIEERVRCRSHPFRKQAARLNEMSVYAADMQMILSYYKCLDDKADDKNLKKAFTAKMLHGGAMRAEEKYPQKAAVIKDRLDKISDREKVNEPDPEICAGMFGELLAEVFDVKGDHWSATLRETGFYLGKFIYLMDAYDDIEKDRKSGSYNPLVNVEDKCVEEMLELMMAASCRAFERLPIIEYADILRNILYGGVWQRFLAIQEKRSSTEMAVEAK